MVPSERDSDATGGDFLSCRDENYAYCRRLSKLTCALTPTSCDRARVLMFHPNLTRRFEAYFRSLKRK